MAEKILKERIKIGGMGTLAVLCLMFTACDSTGTSVNPDSVPYQTQEDEETTTKESAADENPNAGQATDCVLDQNVAEGIEMDVTLADAVRTELGYEKETVLTYKDLENVLSVTAFYDTPITSLKGVSLLKNLSTIMIGGGNIADISELSNLHEITSIDISNCYITKIPDLSACTMLETLYLGNNLIEDISPILKIPSLKYVNLSDNRIKSLAALQKLDTLKVLAIDNNCILDYEELSGNEALICAIDNGSQGTYAQGLEAERLAKKIVESFPKGLTETELEKEIYQYVMDYLDYEIVYTEMAALGYNALTQRKGVCGDYAEMFCLLANHAGLEAYVCTSDTHAWNIVKIDGCYYHCDALWDEPQEEWQYFNVSSESILNVPDHVYEVNRYPDCD